MKNFIVTLLVLFFYGSHCYILRPGENRDGKELNREWDPKQLNSILTDLSKAIVNGGGLLLLEISDDIEQNLPEETKDMFVDLRNRIMTCFSELLANGVLGQEGRREKMMKAVVDSLRDIISEEDKDLLLAMNDAFREKEKEKEIKQKQKQQEMNRLEEKSNSEEKF